MFDLFHLDLGRNHQAKMEGGLDSKSTVVLPSPESPTSKDPFVWNRQNYVLKMNNDCRFLSKHRMLCKFLTRSTSVGVDIVISI
jgi:hypothetical protein